MKQEDISDIGQLYTRTYAKEKTKEFFSAVTTGALLTVGEKFIKTGVTDDNNALLVLGSGVMVAFATSLSQNIKQSKRFAKKFIAKDKESIKKAFYKEQRWHKLKALGCGAIICNSAHNIYNGNATLASLSALAILLSAVVIYQETSNPKITPLELKILDDYANKRS